jgi:hypothetical protein
VEVVCLICVRIDRNGCEGNYQFSDGYIEKVLVVNVSSTCLRSKEIWMLDISRRIYLLKLPSDMVKRGSITFR